jgi:peptide/nickel transport system permease protein
VSETGLALDRLTAPSPRAPGSAARSVGRNPWIRFAARRLIGLFFVLFALVIAVFFMVRLVPGDPAFTILGTEATPRALKEVRHQLGLDTTVQHQFVTYLNNLAHGNLGRSFFTQEPVSKVIRQRVGTSMQLAGAALGLVLFLSIPLGMLAGALTRENRHRRLELLFTGATSVLGAIPDYLTGTILAFIFAVEFRLLPVAGSGGLKTLIMPALAVSLASIATLSRIVRVETLNVLAQDYIRTARSKRLPWRLVFFRHALPNVVTAALTVGGIIFASIVGGAVIVENVFARQGLGTALVQAVTTKDYQVVQGITLVLGVTVVVVNAIVDIVLAIVDPRTLTKQG